MNTQEIQTNPTIPSRAFTAPPFERFPFRLPAEEAVYRTDVPPRGRGNPAYESCPGPRNRPAVDALISTGNPEALPGDIRTRPAATRLEYIDESLELMVPLNRHLALEDMINRGLRNSYVGRNPAAPGYMEKAVSMADQICASFSQTGAGQVGSGSLTGPAGSGKSQSMKRLLRWGFPQVTNLRCYDGQDLSIQVLGWLFVSCPQKASVSGLIEWIAAVLDYIFKTDALARVLRAKNDSARQRIIARELSLHVTGILVIDEIQNMNVGTPEARRVFANFIQELVNTTRTRVMLVGTDEVFDAVTSDALLRRMTGEAGQLRWGRLDFDTEWPVYVRALTEWEVTRTPTVVDEELLATSYRLTGGLPGYAINLWTKAQSIMVGNSNYPNELITPKVLEYTMRRHFASVQELLARNPRVPRHHSAGSSAATDPKPPAGAPSTVGAPDQANAVPVAAPPPRETPPPDGDAPVGYSLQGVLGL